MKLLEQIILYIFFNVINSTFGIFIKRFHFNGILYESFDPDSKNVMYVKSSDNDWKNLSSLVNKFNLSNKAMFCTYGNGAWLIYPEVNFKQGISTSIQIMIGEVCAPAENLQSIQPLGRLNQELLSGIITFRRRYFSSDANALENGSKSENIKSLFHVGAKAYTIEGQAATGMVKLCIRRTSQNETHFCGLSDIPTQLGISGLISIKEGCDDKLIDGSNTIWLQTCYHRGLHEVAVEIDDELDDLVFPNVSSPCKQEMNSTETSLLNKFAKIMEMWTTRINGPVHQMSEKSIKNSVSEIAKTNLFFKVIEIFKVGCPSVQSEYLEILSNVFYNHLREIWKKLKNEKQEPYFDGNRWKDVLNYLSICNIKAVGQVRASLGGEMPISINKAEHTKKDFGQNEKRPKQRTPSTSNPLNFGAECTKNKLTPVDKSNQFVTFMMPSGDQYDVVIEQVFLLLNFINPYCSFVTEYLEEFQKEFAFTVKNAYIDPLQNQWKNPGQWAEIYASVFNGYDIPSEKNKIISCIKDVTKSRDNVKFIERPLIFFNEASSSDVKENAIGKLNF